MVHLHTHRCPCQITVYYKILESHRLFSEPIFMPVTYIYIYIYIYIGYLSGLFIQEILIASMKHCIIYA